MTQIKSHWCRMMPGTALQHQLLKRLPLIFESRVSYSFHAAGLSSSVSWLKAVRRRHETGAGSKQTLQSGRRCMRTRWKWGAHSRHNDTTQRRAGPTALRPCGHLNMDFWLVDPSGGLRMECKSSCNKSAVSCVAVLCETNN